MKKTTLILWSVILMVACIACNEEKLDFYNPEVKLFVKQLKAGTYNTTNDIGTVEVPRFTYKHIPELLQFADDMAELPSFPLPSIPSHFGGKARLGECILWIVEGIRIGQPPSMGCKLVYKDALNYEGIYFLTNEQVVEAASLYRNWWGRVERQGDNVLFIYWPVNPLEESDYRWW